MSRQLLITGGGVALVRLVGMGTGFVLTVVLARTLGAEGLGLYGYVLLLLVLASVSVGYGWATLLLRSVSGAVATDQWSEVRGIQRAASMVAVAVAFLAMMIGLGLALLHPEAGLTPVLALGLAIILLCDQFSALRLSALRGLGHPIWGQLPETLLRPVLVLAVFLGLAWATGPANLSQALTALLVASLLSFVAGTFVLRHKSPASLTVAHPERARSKWAVSAALVATNSGLVILNGQTDFLLLGLLTSTTDLGHYRVAMQIALVSGFGYVALNMIAAQRFAYLYAARDMVQLQATATIMSRIAFLLTLPLPVLFWMWGEPILEIVFGTGFSAAWMPTLILLTIQSVSAACGFNQSMLVMGGAEMLVLPVTVLSVAFCITACLLLIPSMGAIGAALSALLGQLVWNLSLNTLTYFRFGLDVSVLGGFWINTKT